MVNLVTDLWYRYNVASGQGKVRDFFKVSEKSVNFVRGQWKNGLRLSQWKVDEFEKGMCLQQKTLQIINHVDDVYGNFPFPILTLRIGCAVRCNWPQSVIRLKYIKTFRNTKKGKLKGIGSTCIQSCWDP